MADGTLNFDTKIDTKGFKDGTNTIEKQTNSMKSSFAAMGKAAVAAFAVGAMIKFGKEAISTASSLAEVQNVVDTAFGSMSYKMEQFAATSIEAFGMSKLSAKQTGSTFMAMGVGMGITSAAASDMAIALTGLTGDMASFYNVSQDVASTALKSVYTGETESLKQFGVVMTEVNLQEYALSQGIKTSISAMTQREKVMLRAAFVTDKLSLAQGDFAKTFGSWANQTRVLTEQWNEFLGILGTGLITVLTPVVKYLNTALTYMISFANKTSDVLSSVFGSAKATTNAVDNVTSSTQDATDALTSESEAVKAANDAANGVTGFDKLNNMNKDVAKSATSASDALASPTTGLASTATVNVTADTTALESNIKTAVERIKGTISSIWTLISPQVETFKLTLQNALNDLSTLIEPIITLFTGYFVPAMAQVLVTIGTILLGLFDTFNLVFADIWNYAIFPLLTLFITVFLPMWFSMVQGVYSILAVLFIEVKKIFDMLWTEAVLPVITLIVTIWTGFMTILSETWNTYGAPIIAAVKLAIQSTGEVFTALWTSYLKPVFDKIILVLTELWTKHLQPLVKNIASFVAELILLALQIYNKFIAPIAKWFLENLYPVVAKVVKFIIGLIGEILGNLIDRVNGGITALRGLITFISGVFSGDWSKAWEGIKQIFKGVFDSLVAIVKTPVNLIIDIINAMVAGVVLGVNAIINSLNGLDFDIPDWVPGIGGEHVGFNISPVVAPKIPKLATGAVIPPNSEFLATLGDQKSGTNIETPLATMVEAFKIAMGESGGNYTFVAQIDGKTIFSETVKQNKLYKNQTGTTAFA